MGTQFLVGPVSDPNMALQLERAGASAIGVMFHGLPRFPPDTLVDLSSAKSIGENLTKARLCMSLDACHDIERQRDWCIDLKPDYITVDVRQAVPSRLLPIVRATDAKVILLGLTLDYDEDPSWLEKRLQELVTEWEPFAVVVTLLPGLAQPVRWLQEDSGTHEEDVGLNEIERLLASFPVLLNMELEAKDIPIINRHVSSALGFYFFLGEPRDDGGSPVFSDLENTLTLLEASARRTIL